MPSFNQFILHFFNLIETPFRYIVFPSKRLYFVYLISSLVLALWIVGRQKGKLNTNLVRRVFDPRILFHRSSTIDVQLFFLNILVKGFLFFFVTISSIAMAKWVARLMHSFGIVPIEGSVNSTFIMILYAVVSFIALDFSRFYQHYLFHKVPFLWQFHKVHHSAEVLTPMTLYRTHPIESIVASFRRIIVIGFVSGVFVFYTQSFIGGLAIMGVNAFDFIFNFFGSNLRHSHVWLSFGPLNHIFISPAQHQIHHSRDWRHRDKNLGVALALWDKLFGTFYQIEKKEFIIFGLRGEVHENLGQALMAPLRKGSVDFNLKSK